MNNAVTTPVIAMIAALSRNRVIGRDGDLPWHLPADLKHFKATTLGKPVIMGRKTFDSIGKALPGRRNIVISQSRTAWPDGVIGVPSLDQAVAEAGAADPAEIMIIGGGSVYRAALERASRLYLTEVDVEIDGDTLFPEVPDGAWREISRRRVPANGAPYALTFRILERRP